MSLGFLVMRSEHIPPLSGEHFDGFGPAIWMQAG